jgi:FkbM family methyltransferase
MQTQYIKLYSVCHPKDILIWEVASKNILKYIIADKYIVIVPDSAIDKFSLCTPKEYNIIGENFYLKNFNISRLNEKIESTRIGWYLQQFIKLEALKQLKANENAILWDADTIPTKPLKFFNENYEPIFYYGEEYNLSYFNAIRNLMGYDKIVTNSFIAQSFPITYEISNTFFEYLEKYNMKSWYDSIIDCIEPNAISGFSEYETLGTFISHNFPHLLRWNDAKWSRYGFKELTVIEKKDVAIYDISTMSFKYDFLSFENWELDEINIELRRKNNILKRIPKPLFLKKIYYKSLKIFKRQKSKNINEFISEIFSSDEELLVVQVGANDGIQSDTLRNYLTNPGNYSAILIEPIPFFVDSLRKLYHKRDDITIIQSAAGKEYSSSILYYIPSEIALQMNGDGPSNNWALGQGSFSKEVVVYWIHSNSFRGLEYKNKIKDWILNIKEINVPITPTSYYIPNNNKNIFLAIDVQGFEIEVLKGLDWNNSPKYIMIEEDLNDKKAREYLIQNNYQLISQEFDDLLFKLKNS